MYVSMLNDVHSCCLFRYINVESIKFLEECAALDPRFKALTWLSAAKIQDVYDRLTQSIAHKLDEAQIEADTADISEAIPDTVSTE